MTEKLRADNTVFEKIILTIAEYKNVRINSREIFLHGKMYDVKSAIVSDDMIELSVIHDLDEKNILDRISIFIKGTGSPDDNIPVQLQKLVSLIYFSSFVNHTFFIPSFQVPLFFQYTLALIPDDSEILSPPPELV